MSSLLRTLARINGAPQAKVAHAAPAPAAAPSDGLPQLIKQASELLRNAPPVDVRNEDLYAVLKVAEAPVELPAPPSGDTGPDQLRKLAHALRVVELQRQELRMEKAAHMLLATRSLTLLDEQTRSR
jgi:hypothetical protein